MKVSQFLQMKFGASGIDLELARSKFAQEIEVGEVYEHIVLNGFRSPVAIESVLIEKRTATQVTVSIDSGRGGKWRYSASDGRLIGKSEIRWGRLMPIPSREEDLERIRRHLEVVKIVSKLCLRMGSHEWRMLGIAKLRQIEKIIDRTEE